MTLLILGLTPRPCMAEDENPEGLEFNTSIPKMPPTTVLKASVLEQLGVLF